MEGLPFDLDGSVKAVLELQMPDPSNGFVNGQGHFTGSGIEAHGSLLEALDLSRLRFSNLTAFFTVQDNVLTVKENALEGDLRASARGTVRLVPDDPMNSRLDLILDVKPESETKERLSPAFTLMGARQKADGSVSFRIRGTIRRPSITS
jgi:type II secretion system protein N